MPRSRASGNGQGLRAGIVGVVVKPIAGSFDFVTRTMEGGANTFDYALSKLDALMQDDADHAGGSALGESSRRSTRACGHRA